MPRRLFLFFLLSLFVAKSYAGEQPAVLKSDIFTDENGIRHIFIADLHISLNDANRDISVAEGETMVFSRQTDDGITNYLYFDSTVEESDEVRTVSFSDVSVIIHKNSDNKVQVKKGAASIITRW
jgi:hypothetical protein